MEHGFDPRSDVKSIVDTEVDLRQLPPRPSPRYGLLLHRTFFIVFHQLLGSRDDAFPGRTKDKDGFIDRMLFQYTVQLEIKVASKNKVVLLFLANNAIDVFSELAWTIFFPELLDTSVSNYWKQSRTHDKKITN